MNWKIVTVFCLFPLLAFAQQKNYFTHFKGTLADTLRGALRLERTCFIVERYDLNVEVFPRTKSISGKNRITLTPRCNVNVQEVQIDLFNNLQIDSILYIDKTVLSYRRVENAVFISIPLIDTTFYIDFYYSGIPTEAHNPPWDGGLIWKKDEKNKDWISVSCQGIGASLWWPCMDHQSIKPKEMDINITAPKELNIICNGNEFFNKINKNTRTVKWHVSYPINSYNVHFSAGDYVHFSDTFYSKETNEKLPLDYYVIRQNEKKARNHFKQVHKMLEALEYYFGPYPYYRDGYALIETPFLGMEHQSGIAYGNKYLNGYLGSKALSNMDWDFIILHETGHEWWGNLVTSSDIADLWIHEGFTTYGEALYVEYIYGYETALKYLKTQRNRIANKKPLVGPKNVNYEKWVSSDPYYKGTWILNTLRHVIHNDEVWFKFLKDFRKFGAKRSVSSEDFIDFLKGYTDIDIESIMIQYLHHPKLPTLEYKYKKGLNNKNTLMYRWKSEHKGFNMPIYIDIDGEEIKISPTHEFQSIPISCKLTKIDFRKKVYLIKTKQLK